MGWKQWSQTQWDRWGSKLNPAAKRIRGWGFSDEVNETLEKVFDALPSKMKKILSKLLSFLYKYALKKYGIDFVESLVKRLVEFFETFLKGLKGEK